MRSSMQLARSVALAARREAERLASCSDSSISGISVSSTGYLVGSSDRWMGSSLRGCASLARTTMMASLSSSTTAATAPAPSAAKTTLLSSSFLFLRRQQRRPRPYSSSSSYPPHVTLGMPALSPTMSSGNLAAWHVKVGDAVQPGDVLADVETDKATLAWENQDEGYVAALLRPSGSNDVPVGAPLVVLAEEEADVAKFEGYEADGAGGEAAAAPAAASAAPSSPSSSRSSSQPARLLSPAAARVLREAGIPLSLEGLSATGPRGTFTKEDALSAAAGGGARSGVGGARAAAPPAAAAPRRAAPAAPPTPRAPPLGDLPPPRRGSSFEDVPHSQMRRVIASRLSASKSEVPHAYYRADADLSALVRLRSSLKGKAGQGPERGGGAKPPSVNDFVIAAAARALRSVPELNASFDAAASSSDGAKPTPFPSVDICFAVATEGGLITPIVRSADSKGAEQISAEVADLASRARGGKLKPEEFTGGSFTISNLGMFGVSHFSAIINPPQAAILAVGGARQEAVEVEGGGGRGGGGGGAGGGRSVAFVPRLALTLSVDARAVDGDAAGAWLDAFAAALAEPKHLLSG